MKKIYLFMLVMFAYITCMAQVTLTWQNPLPQGNFFFGVAALDVNKMIAVTASATIVKTSDGGNSWSVKSVADDESFLALSFPDATNGWAVGSNGIIYKTSDGGNTWARQVSGTTNTLFAVHFINSTTGYAAGHKGTVVKTTDGGSTWTKLATDSIYGSDLYGVHFLDANTGFVVGSGGKIIKTTDGGATWTTIPSGTTMFLQAITFINPTTGWIVSMSGTILKTTDGGLTWENQNSGTMDFLYSVSFISATQGWICGTSGTILTTSDGGSTWSRQTSGTNLDLVSVDFQDQNNGWIVGGAGMILKTTDGGLTWISQRKGSTALLHSLSFTDAQTGWAVGDSGRIFHTVNGGSNWIAQTSGTPYNLNSVDFIDNNFGLAVGDSGTILRTTDGGETWMQITPRPTVIYSHVDICHDDVTHPGYITDMVNLVSYDGRVMNSDDHGQTWTSHYFSGDPELNAVCFEKDHGQEGVTVGDGGKIFITRDGGKTWYEQNSGTDRDLFGIFMDRDDNFLIIGEDGVLIEIQHGLNHLSILNTGTLGGSNLYSGKTVYPPVTSRATIFAAGGGGKLVSSIDSGYTWNYLPSGTSNDFYSMAIMTQNAGKFPATADSTGLTGWLCGENGTIMTIQISSGPNSLPPTLNKTGGTIILYPSYPNPSQGSTTFPFYLKTPGYVTLSIYTLSGQKIETILNKVFLTGEQAINWDCSRLEPGVYLYTLQVGNTVETGKMVLIR